MLSPFNIFEIVLYSIVTYLPYFFLMIYPFWNMLRFPKRLSICMFSVLNVWTILCSALISLTGNALFSYLTTGIFILLYFASIKAHPGKILFIFLMVSNLTNSTVFLAKYLEGILFPALARETLRWSYSLTIVIVELVLGPFVFLFFKKQFREAMAVQVQNKIWNYLWLIPGTFYLFWFYFVYLNSLAGVSLEFDFFNTIFTILVNSGAMLIYYVVARTVREFAQNLDLHMQNDLLTIQNLQYENLKERMDETKRARHDLRHHMTVLHSLCQNGEYDELTTYTQNFLNQTSTDYTISYCGNLTMNALLSYYAQTAKDCEIDFSISISLPEDIPIQDTDLCVLLGNLIENACDGCMTLPKDKRRMCFKMLMPNHGSVVFTLDNTFEGKAPQKENGQFLSSKHKGYGIGLDSASGIVNRYNGVLKTDAQNGIFCVSVVLNP